MTDTARALFPLMPVEVFDEWLGGLIALQGWPFTHVDDPIRVDDWSRIFLERPLAEWTSFTWTSEAYDHIDERLSRGSRADIVELMMHGLPQGSGASDIIRDSENRYRKAIATMIEIKGFPGFVTAYEDSSGKLCVVNRHHRLAALSSFRGYKSIKVPFWIARTPT